MASNNSTLALLFALFLILNVVAEAQKSEVVTTICHKDSSKLSGDCKSKAECKAACLKEEDIDAFTGTCIQEFTTQKVKGVCRDRHVSALDPFYHNFAKKQVKQHCDPDTTTRTNLPTKRCVCSSICSG